MYAGWEWELWVQEARVRVVESGPRTEEKPDGWSPPEVKGQDLVLYTVYHKSDDVVHGRKSQVNVPQ
jgi:hypothetical protein